MGDVRAMKKDMLAVARLIVALLPGGKLIAVTREPRQFRHDGRKKGRAGKLLVSRYNVHWRLRESPSSIHNDLTVFAVYTMCTDSWQYAKPTANLCLHVLCIYAYRKLMAMKNMSIAICVRDHSVKRYLCLYTYPFKQ